MENIVLRYLCMYVRMAVSSLCGLFKCSPLNLCIDDGDDAWRT